MYNFVYVISYLVQDMTQPVPTQELVAKDLHGIEWHFKHIFRGDNSFFFGFTQDGVDVSALHCLVVLLRGS